ncbi:MAG: carboxypeptidase regulatory-like domain-containing protein [Rhodothermales bacterium]
MLCLLSALPSYAQFATLSGRVTDAETEQSMQGVNVVLDAIDGDQRGMATNAEGLYTFDRLLPGDYILTISFVGYLAQTDTLAIEFGQRISYDAALQPDQEMLDEVVVEEERVSTSQEGFAGFERIGLSDLKRVPMPGVSPDLAAYLTTQPGFVTTGDRGGQLFVRGGTPTQNLMMVDGMMLYQPFHIIGFYSALPADLVSNVDVYAGGFGARYGGRLSSVIDVTTRSGNKQKTVGAVSLAPFLGTARIEVPVVPGEASLILSARESLIERVAPNLLGQEMPYRFGDQFAKFHAFLTPTSSVSLTALHTHDQGRINGQPDTPLSTWSNLAAGGRFNFIPEESAVMMQFGLYYSNWASRYALSRTQQRRAEVSGVNFSMNFVYLMGESQFDFGIMGRTNLFDYDLGGRGNSANRSVTEGTFYADGRFQINPTLRIEPGFRLQTFTTDAGQTIGPRLRVLIRPSGPTSRQVFSVAWGLYHQVIVGLSNEADVTDAFIAWAPSPAFQGVPTSMHLIGGWTWRMLPWLEWKLEAYQKTLENLAFPRYNETTNEPIGLDLTSGDIIGADASVEITLLNWYAAANYSLSKVEYERTSGLSRRETFSPAHDRRHQINLLTQVTRGDYRLNVRWQFGSGQPFTQIGGYYEAYTAPQPETRDFHTATGRTRLDRGPIYGGRLPTYHRLDITLQRDIPFKHGLITVQAGVINGYDRNNLFTYDLFTNERINQLPLIPTLGINVDLQ